MTTESSTSARSSAIRETTCISAIELMESKSNPFLRCGWPSREARNVAVLAFNLPGLRGVHMASKCCLLEL